MKPMKGDTVRPKGTALLMIVKARSMNLAFCVRKDAAADAQFAIDQVFPLDALDIVAADSAAR